MNRASMIDRILASRRDLVASLAPVPRAKAAEEGGCGVVGFASNVPLCGRHIFEPSIQMHNRGNGKGGGIAAAGVAPEALGVDEATLRNDYLLQIALLDSKWEAQVEKSYIKPFLQVDHRERLEPAADWQELGLEVRPPDIVRYFVRVKPDVLARFADHYDLKDAPEREVEDEFIFRNSIKLNETFYASLGEKRAFVLSHARNLIIFKIVGYAEQVVQYYGLENLKAKVWIAHQRYPTKGRVWHPAGAHPFIGLNDALVHNGDFANYYGVTEYLRQHNLVPQFLTDTEVSVLLFDLWSRTFKYPLEYVIEGLAPTTELDLDQVSEEKRRIYAAIQSLHVHGSPDGPWFFIIARSDVEHDRYQLVGITDTSMLRPQVFAIQEGEVSIGLVASEKQAIDATLHSLAAEDSRFRLVADRYWNARGGSHTDGGAFVFTVQGANGSSRLTCADKFGREVKSPAGSCAVDLTTHPEPPPDADEWRQRLARLAGAESGVPVGSRPVSAQPAALVSGKTENGGPVRQGAAGSAEELFGVLTSALGKWSFDKVRWLLDEICQIGASSDSGFVAALELLTLLNDRRYDCGDKRPGMVLQLVRQEIDALFDSAPSIESDTQSSHKRIDWASRDLLRPPAAPESVLIIHARDFPPEGDDCDARLAVRAYELGWRRFIHYGLKGQRFQGCGLGPATDPVRVDLYGSSGDYVASGLDGMELVIHGNGQDQLGQILKRGRVVVQGDVGQAFLYGAKGGEIYVMGNAAGRPLINAVGRPRVVINGTALDFLAESFMAGDPHNGGGFVILNGIRFDDQGRVVPQPTPYPGSNLFSLASGGAIFVRDPHGQLVPEQLNGGEFSDFTDQDWHLILPYLKANERLFGISIERDLLTVDGVTRGPEEVYRKVRAVKLGVLAKKTVPE